MGFFDNNGSRGNRGRRRRPASRRRRPAARARRNVAPRGGRGGATRRISRRRPNQPYDPTVGTLYHPSMASSLPGVEGQCLGQGQSCGGNGSLPCCGTYTCTATGGWDFANQTEIVVCL